MGYAIYSNIHVYPIAFASFGNFFVRSLPSFRQSPPGEAQQSARSDGGQAQGHVALCARQGAQGESNGHGIKSLEKPTRSVI